MGSNAAPGVSHRPLIERGGNPKLFARTGQGMAFAGP